MVNLHSDNNFNKIFLNGVIFLGKVKKVFILLCCSNSFVFVRVSVSVTLPVLHPLKIQEKN
jgi:hypothetical protein